MNDYVLDAIIDTMVYVHTNHSQSNGSTDITTQNKDNVKISSPYLAQFQGNFKSLNNWSYYCNTFCCLTILITILLQLNVDQKQEHLQLLPTIKESLVYLLWNLCNVWDSKLYLPRITKEINQMRKVAISHGIIALLLSLSKDDKIDGNIRNYIDSQIIQNLVIILIVMI